MHKRIAEGIKRLSEPKIMFNYKDELINSISGESITVRRARAYCATLAKIEIPIYDNELIVGDVPYYEFRANKELITSFLTPEEKAKLQNNAREKYFEMTGKYPPNFENYKDTFHTCANYGHIIADYAMLLNLGLKGMIDSIDPKNDFLCSVKITLQGASEYIKRYSEKSLSLAQVESDVTRKNELKKISENCMFVSENPPQNFHQALQLLWFHQLLMEIESGISAFSFGRMDKYLYPFLKNDVEKGIITIDEAQELTDCFFVKANEQNNVTSDAGRAITVGGTDIDGNDIVNEMTYILLNSAIRTQLLQPKINARIHKGSPSEYFELCAEGAVRNAGVQMYNDEVIIDSLVKFGYKYEDSVDYGIIGCYEYGLAGIHRPSPMSVTFHLGKCFEYALNVPFETYDELKNEFQNQVSHYTKIMADSMLLDELVCQRIRPLPFLSAFVGDCVKNATDISCCGARYKTAGVRFTGFSAVADSLTAVKTLVFEEKKIDKNELLESLKNNFAGKEPLRQKLINKAPKYGNDNDIADNTARELGEFCCQEVLKRKHISGSSLCPGLFSFLNFLNAGENCGAFPNGRKAGEPFVNGISPMHGADRQGPTAMLSSAAKLNYALSPNGTALDLKLQGSIYNTPQSYKQLTQMLRAYFEMGGAQVQAYSLSVDELLAAKANPEKYANLIIRVTGYSAYFVTLDDNLQNEIINRTVGLK